MCYVLFIGFYDWISVEFYAVYANEQLAYNDGEKLKESNGCDYFYVSRQPLIRDTNF